MATVSEIRIMGTEIFTVENPILEPLNAIDLFHKRLRRFGDNYNTNVNTHLYRFLLALCGESGAGALKKSVLYPRLQSMLESTQFTDLDRLFGAPLALPRLSDEIYLLDPKSQALTQAQWAEVKAKDADYRARCLTWMRAIIHGSTLEGIRLAAEAACGIECDVFERYRFVENSTFADVGLTSSRSEFVIMPRAPSITQSEKRRISRLVDRLKPVGSLATVIEGDYLRTERAIQNVGSTSDRFSILRYVTGRADVNWPSGTGMWVATDEREAPTFAFMDRQESVTYLTIVNAEASSSHIGPFNQSQQSLFAHLKTIPEREFGFDPYRAYATPFAPITIQSAWTASTGSNPGDVTLVNTYYPIEYFSNPSFTVPTPGSPNHFWASQEKLAPESDELVIDLGRERPVNFIHLEICYKPIDIEFEYSTDKITWTPFAPHGEHRFEDGVHYLPSLDNSWHKLEARFSLTTARYVRLTFTRREQRFPLDTSDFFAYSIDVRNLRVMHVVATLDDMLKTYTAEMLPELPTINYNGRLVLLTSASGGFSRNSLVEWRDGAWNAVYYHGRSETVDGAIVTVPLTDRGTDILGNSYRTDIDIMEPLNVLDEEDPDEITMWQSQPNPSRYAVEALYFDLRSGYQAGTMGYLNTQAMIHLNGRSMADLEQYYTGGVVVDEVYIDPVTYGPDLSIYYSLDDEAEWDNKLWIPIPERYVLKKGIFAFPRPIYTKYIKLEFSKLAAAPYNAIEFPVMPPPVYRKFPSWVQEYFNNLAPALTTWVNPTELVTIDPLSFGFKLPIDKLHTNYETIRKFQMQDHDSDIKVFIDELLGQKQSDSLAVVEDEIVFYSPYKWQFDLINQLDPTRALSRVAKLDREDFTDTGWTAELDLILPDPILFQSTQDLSQSRREKRTPTMYFPQRCRHQYQLVEADRPGKIAYFVAIKTVQFFRRDYTVPFDEPYYIESLDDDMHIEASEFVPNEWRYEVLP